MGSGYFGEQNLGNERSGPSRKTKKSNLDNKPKQPQRGLGVAQLEKIRLHSEMGSSTYLPSLQEDMRLQTTYAPSSSFSYPSSSSTSYGFPRQQNFMMGFSDMERANTRYGDSQSSISRLPSSAAVIESQHFVQPNMTRHLFNLQVEEKLDKRRSKGRSGSIGSSSQNSESSANQELDLELRLSL